MLPSRPPRHKAPDPGIQGDKPFLAQSWGNIAPRNPGGAIEFRRNLVSQDAEVSPLAKLRIGRPDLIDLGFCGPQSIHLFGGRVREVPKESGERVLWRGFLDGPSK